jgi:hypothetical protein
VLLTIAAVVAAAIIADRTGPGRAATRPVRVSPANPSVPGADAVSAAWYCPEGTAAPGGRADETVYIANVGDSDVRARLTALPASADQKPKSRRVDIPKRGRARVQLSDVLDSAEQLDPAGAIIGPGVIVEVFGGRSVVEHSIQGDGDFAVGACARRGERDWYFAAGTTVRGAEQYLSLLNPFSDDAVVDVTFVTDAGFQAPPDLQGLVVSRRTRLTVPVHNVIRRQAQISAHVHARTGRIVAEESLRFTADNETRRGLALSLGVTAPASSWTFTAGAAEAGASDSVAVANFNAAATEVEVSVRLDGNATVAPMTVPVAGRSVAVVDIGAAVPAGAEYAVEVRATRPGPIIAEELASWVAPAAEAGAATEVGAPLAAKRWVFAVGRLGDTNAVVSVLNPGRAPATVGLLAYESGRLDRPRSGLEQAVDPGKRVVFDLAALGVGPDQVVVVTANHPVVAMRRVAGASGTSLSPGVPDLT